MRFWELWPQTARKVDKRQCAEIWRKDKLEERTEEILGKVALWSATDQWQKGYEPSPLKWLKQRRDDDLPGDMAFAANGRHPPRAWEEHATHSVARYPSGPYCNTCQRDLLPSEVPPKPAATDPARQRGIGGTG